LVGHPKKLGATQRAALNYVSRNIVVHNPKWSASFSVPCQANEVALDGNRIVVSAVVGLRDAKRLLKRLEANIALLEEEEKETGENEEAAN
jgi:hypothetical protein